MKLALVFGLVAVALASQHWDQRPEILRDRSFQAGRHYTYKFDGQIATGLPQPSSQHSATRVQSLVSIVFEDDRTALLKLQQTRVGTAQRDLVEPREVQPFGLFEETEMTSEQKEQLSLPLRFRYEHGLVSEIEFDRDEPTWSANIKRAILNMLQLNLGKKSLTGEKEMTKLRTTMEVVETPENDFFSTQEMTLEGDCETGYTVVPAGEDKLRVTKSINFERCSKRIDIRYNYRFGEECPSCEKKFNGEEQNTESSTVLRFEINGNTEHFLIREVELKSNYLFSPLSKEQQFMGTAVANTLTLIRIDSETSSMAKPRSEKKEHLVYSTEWEEKLEQFRMTGEESLLKKSPFPWMTKKMEIAKKIMDELKQQLLEEDKVELAPEANHQVARLVEVLRVCTKEEISKLDAECPKDQLVRSVFYDAMAIAGTKTTIEYLVQQIVAKEIVPMKAAGIVKMLMNIRNPSEQIVDMLVRLAREDVVEKHPILKQSVWLTTGALLNGLCGETRDRVAMEVSFSSRKSLCPRETKDKYVDLLESRYSKASTRYEKILALKTMANAGIDLIVYPLEKIIKDPREEKSVRLQAVDALRQLRSVMPRKLQHILMPIYKNVREAPEMRAAAFHQIMQSIPLDRMIIDQITEQLAKEPCHQVHAFVYSALKSLAKSDLACEKDTARDIEYSLKLARVQPRKMLDSQLLRASLYSEEFYTGASLNWATLFSNDSVLPKEMMASVETIFAGEWNKYLAQVGVAQQNMDQLLYKLMDKLENNEEIIVRGKRSMLAKPVEALKQMMTKMGIKQRRHSEDQAHAMVYLRYKDLDYAVIPIEEKLVAELFKNIYRSGRLDLSEIEKVLAKGYRFNADIATFIYEKTRIIPTTLGLPLEIIGKLPTVASIEGELRAELEPKSGKGVEGLKVRLMAQPKLAVTHIAHMELRSPIVSQGVKLLHSLFVNTPIDMELELNWERKFEAKLTVKAPEREQQMVVMHSRPVSYIRFEANERKMERAVEKTIFVPDQAVVEIDRAYGQRVFGLRFNVRGAVHKHILDKMQQGQTLPIFVCENHMEIAMARTPDAPKEYVFTMRLETGEGEEMTERPEQFSRFFESHDEQIFEVEDSEYLPEDEKERRGEFARYVSEYKKDGSSKPAYKYRMVFTAETVGSRVERRGDLALKSLCDREMTYCWFKLEASRSPMMEGEQKNWLLSASVQTLFPEPILTLKQLHEQKHREAHALIEAKWGAEQKNSIKAKIQAEQSKEQQQWQRLTIRKAENAETESLESLDKLELASRLNQLKMVAEYEISPECQIQIGRISSLLKAWKPLTSTIVPRFIEKSYERAGRLVAKISVEPQTWRYANLSLESPSERLVLESVRLPFRPTFLSIEKTQAVRGMTQLARRSLDSQPVCEVSSKRVNTFDEVIYRAPLTTCFSVLAKDCSVEPRFAVLMRTMKKDGEEKKMKIVDGERVIEMEMRNEMVVKIDGKVVKDEDRLAEHGLEKRGEVMVFESDDIFVRFDGYKAEIRMNEYYKNKQCGMCGHYDGEERGEFRRADNQETEELEDFHRSFLSKDEECEMEEEKLSKKDNYKRWEKKSWDTSSSSEEDFSLFHDKKKMNKQYYEDEETVEPEEKTRVMEKGDRVCFSKEPVRECPRNTYAKETEEMKIKFSCTTRYSSDASRLLRQARRGVVSVEGLPYSSVETLAVPKMCTVY